MKQTPRQQFDLHLDWATGIAAKLVIPKMVERQEVVSLAHIGLWEACLRQPALNSASFKRFSYQRIRGSVRDFFRKTPLVSFPRAEFKKGNRPEGAVYADSRQVRWGQIEWAQFESLMDEFQMDAVGDDDALLERTETMKDALETLKDALETLSEKNRRVLVECVGNDVKQVDLAAQMGVTPARISQRLNEALARMRAEMLKSG